LWTGVAVCALALYPSIPYRETGQVAVLNPA